MDKRNKLGWVKKIKYFKTITKEQKKQLEKTKKMLPIQVTRKGYKICVTVHYAKPELTTQKNKNNLTIK